MNKTSAVIFDMDGLLLATEDVYTEVTSKVVAGYGKVFEWKTKAKMMGRSAGDAYQILIDELNLPLAPHELGQIQEPLLLEGFANALAMPGAYGLTELLGEKSIPMALATSSSRDLYLVKTERHKDWFRCFDAILTGDDVERLKPEPDIFLEAARRLGREPEQCLVFEDAVAGVSAAKAAGMQVVAVIDQRADREAYQDADLVLHSLDEFSVADWAWECS